MLRNNNNNIHLVMVVEVSTSTNMGIVVETVVESKREEIEEEGVVDPLTNPVRLILMT